MREVLSDLKLWEESGVSEQYRNVRKSDQERQSEAYRTLLNEFYRLLEEEEFMRSQAEPKVEKVTK